MVTTAKKRKVMNPRINWTKTETEEFLQTVVNLQDKFEMDNRIGQFMDPRVLPIFNSLENGKTKMAFKGALKLLKKQPNLLCAKALKCLALLRLGKDAESLELLETVINEVPTDYSTLRAIRMFYADLYQPQEICKVYEQANQKEPDNLYILECLFLTYIPTADYAKQKLTAVALNRAKPNNRHYFWAVISTLLQSVDSVTDLTQFCAIPSRRNNSFTFTPSDKTKNDIALLHRVMRKFVNDGKIESGEEVLIYILVLEMSEKYEEALNTLNGPLGAKLEITPLTLMHKKLDLHARLGRWDEVNAQLEEMLKDSDCYHCYMMYLESVFELAKDKGFEQQSDESHTYVFSPPHVKAKQFLDGQIETQKGPLHKKREPYLARLEYYRILTEKNLPASDLLGEIMLMMENYYVEFSAKETCCHDLRPYLNLCGKDIFNFLLFVFKCIGVSSYNTMPVFKEQSDLTFSHSVLENMVGLTSIYPEDIKKNFIVNNVNRFIGTLHLYADAAPTAFKACDAFLLLALHSLFELWVDTEDSNYLFEAIVLGEYSLSHSPDNSQVKILLLKFYHLLGGTMGAVMTHIMLGREHMELDSLGYLHLFPILTSAAYGHGNDLLIATMKFFANSVKENTNQVTCAYANRWLTKILELTGLREKIVNSTHYQLSTAEMMLLEMFTSADYEDCFQVAKNINITIIMDRIRWDELQDNRDFTVLLDIDGPDRRLTEECVTQSHNHDCVLLRLRSLLLHCIVSCLNVGKAENPQGDGEQTENLLTYDETRSEMMKHMSQLEEALKPVKDTIPEPLAKKFIAGPPVSRLILMLEVGYFDLILTQLCFLHSLVPCANGSRKACQHQLEEMKLLVSKYMNDVSIIAGSLEIQLRNAFVQMCALLVELVCFCCIVVGVCVEVMTKAKQDLDRKKKTKKNKTSQQTTGSPDELEWRVTLINGFIQFLTEVIEQLDAILTSEKKVCSDSKTSSEKLVIFCNFGTEQENARLASFCPLVSDTLKVSYMANISQMLEILKSKLIYLIAIKLQLL